MIGIVDYGLGNKGAFINIYNQLDIPAKIIHTCEDFKDATHIILPGVGAFDWAMERLAASGLRDCLDRLVLEEKLPVLGVCVGMQMMCHRSDEGNALGLGWIDAEVRRLNMSHSKIQNQLPHMGWNEVRPKEFVQLFEEITLGTRFYFLHSYSVEPNNHEDIISTTDYGRVFVSAVRRENIFGVQFHPEKSHKFGVQLLKNFANF